MPGWCSLLRHLTGKAVCCSHRGYLSKDFLSFSVLKTCSGTVCSVLAILQYVRQSVRIADCGHLFTVAVRKTSHPEMGWDFIGLCGFSYWKNVQRYGSSAPMILGFTRRGV